MSLASLGSLASTVAQIILQVLALASPIALSYRYWWGAKSQVTIKQLPNPRKRNWSYGTTDDHDYWSNYIHAIAVNKGWWTGLLWDISLNRVIFDGETTVADVDSDVGKIEIDTYPEADSERIDLNDPHQRAERSFPGRDISHLKIAPFFSPDGELAKHATNSDYAEFRFDLTVQDNKREDTVQFIAELDVSDVFYAKYDTG